MVDSCNGNREPVSQFFHRQASGAVAIVLVSLCRIGEGGAGQFMDQLH